MAADQNAYSSNVIKSKHIDVQCDAQGLPFRTGSVANLFLRAVLHHIEDPVEFLVEAEGALTPGGRIIMHEPHISLLSRILYMFHFESCDTNPAELKLTDRSGVVVDSNVALPDLCFLRHWDRIQLQVPQLKLVEISYQDVLAYTLTGGLHYRQLLPNVIPDLMCTVEKALPHGVLAHLSCVMVVVLERAEVEE